MNITKALNLFGLTLPFTEEDLKTKYRILAKQYHSDLTHGSDEMMKDINSAHEILKKYLKNPAEFEIEARRYAWKEEQRQKAAERNAEERRRQAEAQRREAEERQRRAEERRQQEELRRKAEEEKKRQEEAYLKEQLEKRIAVYREINLFKCFSTSEDSYRNDPSVKKELDTLYRFIKECMTQKDSYIKNYKKSHPNDSKKINAYKRNIKEQFKDLESATEYVASMYVDYFAYGFVFGRTDLNDLKAYVFKDDHERRIFKINAFHKLQEYTSIQKMFLSPLDEIAMGEIESSQQFSKEISLQQDIEHYVHTNYDFNEGIVLKPFSLPEARTILDNFKHFNYDNHTELNLRLFISNIANIAIKMNEMFPYDLEFRHPSSWATISKLSYKYDKLVNLYRQTKNANWEEISKCYLHIKNDPGFIGISIFGIINSILERQKNLELINNYYQNIDLITLVKLPTENYKTLVKKAQDNKQRLEELTKRNPEYKIYLMIYQSYKDEFTEGFDIALEQIKARVSYIKTFGLSDHFVELYHTPDEDLKKAYQKEVRKSKTAFILKYHPRFSKANNTTNVRYNPEKDPGLILLSMDDTEFENIYKQTFIAFVNEYHPEFKLTPQEYDQMTPSSKREYLEGCYFNIKLLELTKRAQKLSYLLKDIPTTYEEIRNLDGKQLEELKQLLDSAEQEEFFRHLNNNSGRKS